MELHYKKTSLHYQITGRGPALVLLHGFLWDSTLWKPFLPILSQKFKVITIDLLGHGKSGEVNSVHEMSEIATSVAHILAHEKIEKTRIIGHSMGGYVGLAFAEKFPEQLEALVLLHSTPKADNEERKANRNRAISLVQRHKHAFVRMGIVNLFDKETMPSETAINQAVLAAENNSVAAISANLRGMRDRQDYTVILQKFKGEKIIIAGKKDVLIPFEKIQETAQETHCQFITFPGGHMGGFFEDKALLHAFLEKL